MKYAAIVAIFFAPPAYAETGCEAALAYVTLTNEQTVDRSNLVGDVRDELSLGVPMLSTDALQKWYADVSTSFDRVAIHEMKATRKRMEAVKRLSDACR